MKSIIVLGLTYNQVPLIEKAQEMGYRAIAIGAGGGAPVAAEVADAWFPIDTSDKEAVVALAEQQDTVGLVTCGTSTAMCTAAYVTEKLGLSDKMISHATSLDAVFKDRFRKLLGPLLPRGVSGADPAEAFAQARNFTFPLIVKPGDGGGGKGITVVRQADRDSFIDAFDYAAGHSRSKVVIAEEFIEGPVLGAESLVLDGTVHLLVVADKVISAPPRCVTLGVAFPSVLPDQVQQRIAEVNASAISQLSIRWGPTHIDMAVTSQGEPRIIDIGPRLAGGPLMAQMVPDAFGYDFYRAAIDLATGREVPPPGAAGPKHYASKFLVTDKAGVLKGLHYAAQDVSRFGIENIRQLKDPGSVLAGVSNDGARLLFFTTKGDSREQAMLNLQNFSETVHIDVD